MKKIIFMMMAVAVLFATSASAATKKSSWVPYPEWIKSKKK